MHLSKQQLSKVQLFAKAGLEVHGMDFSPAMLEICRDKGFAIDLRRHDIQKTPWPYSSSAFDHLVCCGVMHFIPDLEGIFDEAQRVLLQGGLFAFTTRHPIMLETEPLDYERQITGGFEVFSHAPAHLERLLVRYFFTRLKMQKCYVGDDLFMLWVVGRQ